MSPLDETKVAGHEAKEVDSHSGRPENVGSPKGGGFDNLQVPQTPGRQSQRPRRESKSKDHAEILYSIVCKTLNGLRTDEYELRANPFTKTVLHEKPRPPSSSVIRVVIEARGALDASPGAVRLFPDIAGPYGPPHQLPSVARFPQSPRPPNFTPHPQRFDEDDEDSDGERSYMRERRVELPRPVVVPRRIVSSEQGDSDDSPTNDTQNVGEVPTQRYPPVSVQLPFDDINYESDSNGLDEKEGSLRGDDTSNIASDIASAQVRDANMRVGVDYVRSRPKTLKELVDDGEFRATAVEVTSIHIHSQPLIALIRSFIREYPLQTLKGEWIILRAPFHILAHYYKSLVALRDGEGHDSAKSFGSGDAKDTQLIKPLDQETKSHLGILLNYFEPIYAKDFMPEEVRFNNTGVVTYPFLWFLFKPGTNVYARRGGKLAGFVFERYEMLSVVDQQNVTRYFWVAICWNLTFNGRRIVRSQQRFTIKRFKGEREIQSLPVFPSIYLDTVDGGKTRTKLQELGEKFYGIIREGPSHVHYAGPTWDLDRIPSRDPQQRWQKKKPEIEYKGEAIIDHRRTTYNRRKRAGSPVYLQPRRVPYYEDSVSEGNESTDSDDDGDALEPLELDTRSARTAFVAIKPKNREQLTAQHYFLLPRSMTGFALSQKQRMGFDVEYIKRIDWLPNGVDPMDTLILGEADKDVLRALARKYSKGKDNWGADFIRGKGEGQIFLLHGPPGTGKTFTVECVAKLTQRPLLRLTVADIGTNEREMEDNLGEWFQRGADWGAIILIDEADVFLEKRQIKDLQRNSLVSVFLSSMEYYTGMLFLTTNRIGQIDDAFLSRTSVALTYETLDHGKQRRIWDGFLKKLADERKDITLTDRAKKFIEGLDKNETTKDVPWNGREIRNALQTAIALASYDADKEAEECGEKRKRILVRDSHFEAVVDRRKDFIEYRRSIRNQDEDARAYQEGNRAPPPKKK